MIDEYISIQEFANLAGITRQTVYNKLDTDLTEFVKVVNNRKRISRAALKHFGIDEVDNNVKDDFTDFTDVVKGVIKTLQQELSDKTEQLKVKDQQISELNDRLKEAHHLAAQSNLITANTQEPAKKIINSDPLEPDPENIKLKKKGFWGFLKR